MEENVFDTEAAVQQIRRKRAWDQDERPKGRREISPILLNLTLGSPDALHNLLPTVPTVRT